MWSAPLRCRPCSGTSTSTVEQDAHRTAASNQSSSPPDGLAGQGAEQPPAREPERASPRAASRVRSRRAAPALDPAHGAGDSAHAAVFTKLR